MRNFFFLVIIACANDLFALVPWYHIPGVFNINDVGNGLIGVGLLFALLQKNPRVLWNPISFLIVAYLLFVTIQASLASIYFKQPILDGIIRIRHQFFYLSFFLFVLVLDSRKKLKRIFDMLSVVAVLLLLLSVINYFGPVIFHHMWAEGHGIRAGIKRAFIPGMAIVSFAALWEYSKWLENSFRLEFRTSTCTLLFIAHFFRQTRGRIIGLLFAIFGTLVVRRKLKSSFVLIAVFVCFAVVFEITSELRIFTDPFNTVASDMVRQEGTWKARLAQIQVDLQEFKRHPWMGSGLVAIKMGSVPWFKGDYRDLPARAHQVDLGYTHWVKMYGIAGILWLGAFSVVLFNICRTSLRRTSKQEDSCVLLGVAYLAFVAVSFVTLNHLMRPDLILFVCLSCAILVRTSWEDQHR